MIAVQPARYRRATRAPTFTSACRYFVHTPLASSTSAPRYSVVPEAEIFFSRLPSGP